MADDVRRASFGHPVAAAPRRLKQVGASLPAILRSTWPSLFRIAAYFAILAGAICSISLTLPAQGYFATADYRFTDYTYEINGFFTQADVREFEQVADPDSVASFLLLSPGVLKHDQEAVSPVGIYLFRDPKSLGRSWFAPETTVARTHVTGEAWIDLGASTARDLGVGPGETIAIGTRSGDIPVRVRRVLALKHGGLPIAVGPVYQEIDSRFPGLFATVVLLKSDLDVEDMSRMVPASATLDTREAAVARAHELVVAPSDAVPLGLTAIGGLCLIGWAAREGARLVFRRGTTLTILLATGARRSSIVAGLVIAEGAAVAVGLLVAWWVTVNVAFAGLLQPALPPVFRWPLSMGLLGAYVAYLLASAMASARLLNRRETLGRIMAGRAH